MRRALLISSIAKVAGCGSKSCSPKAPHGALQALVMGVCGVTRWGGWVACVGHPSINLPSDSGRSTRFPAPGSLILVFISHIDCIPPGELDGLWDGIPCQGSAPGFFLRLRFGSEVSAPRSVIVSPRIGSHHRISLERSPERRRLRTCPNARLTEEAVCVCVWCVCCVCGMYSCAHDRQVFVSWRLCCQREQCATCSLL